MRLPLLAGLTEVNKGRGKNPWIQWTACRPGLVVAYVYIQVRLSYPRMEYIDRILHAYPALIDFTLYFFVFGAAARVGFAKSFPSHEGKVLAVAVGLFLAASLAIAQRKLGFSLERMGPVAAFLLCGVIFIAAYRFMKHADVPVPLTVLLSGLMVLVLARAVMPELTGRFIRENPLIVLLVLLGAIYWAWNSSQGYLEKITNRRPGRLLGKHHAVPDETFLKKEARFTKKRLKNTTHRGLKEEKELNADLDEAADLVNKGKDSARDRARLAKLLGGALAKANHIHNYCEKLLQFDGALHRVDVGWLKQVHAFNLSDLTPEQQMLLKESLSIERRKIRTEDLLKELQVEVDKHLQAVTEFVRKAKGSLDHGVVVGTAGWIAALKLSRRRQSS